MRLDLYAGSRDLAKNSHRKESSMQQTRSTLDEAYENWRMHNDKLRTAIESLTDEQLRLQPAPGMWTLGQILQHIISVRAGWFSGTLQEPDEAMEAYMDWGQPDSPPRSAAELARGLNDTWAFIESRLQRWTPEECAMTFPDEWEGGIDYVSRNWVIFHVLEHDYHHAGEASLILGMNKLTGIDV
jgi:uncharacterized damage-inducible protein DinB